MEKEKLNDAAKINADEICDSLSECWFNDDGGYTDRELEYNDLIESFKSGAEWLMGQPLAERLTEEEKSRIIEDYKSPVLFNESFCNGYKAALIEYFGKEMFESK